MGKITDALNKAKQEKEVEKQDWLKGQNKNAAENPPLLLPLEERLKKRISIAKARDDSGIDPRIVTYFDPKSIISEQYRILRTNIQSNNQPRPLKTLLVSSALGGEGKTITAINLAITMASDLDKNVLLIDCDLRAGILHRLLAINTTSGLSDILLDGTAEELAFYKTRINNLTLLPRGVISHNPSELLGSKKMRGLLQELKDKFDYIILDSPAAIPVTDACVLGSQVDGVIFVVQAYMTQRRMVEHAYNLFKHVHAKILGFVLTQTDFQAGKYMYRYAGNIQKKQ